jgi:hypothetical protein
MIKNRVFKSEQNARFRSTGLLCGIIGYQNGSFFNRFVGLSGRGLSNSLDRCANSGKLGRPSNTAKSKCCSL